jgi:hypothetical protein
MRHILYSRMQVTGQHAHSTCVPPGHNTHYYLICPLGVVCSQLPGRHSSLSLSSQSFPPFHSYYHQSCKRVAHQLFLPSPLSFPIPPFLVLSLPVACCPQLLHIPRVVVVPRVLPPSLPQPPTGRAPIAGTAQIRTRKMMKSGSGRQNKHCCCRECVSECAFVLTVADCVYPIPDTRCPTVPSADPIQWPRPTVKSAR